MEDYVEMVYNKIKILVADDEDNIRHVIVKILGNKYIVLEAKDGEQAVQVARSHRPDLIIMYIFMPKMDGCTACAHLKKSENTRSIPIVAMTGKGGPLEEKLVMAMGAKGYLSKPFDQKKLLDVVSSALKKVA